MIKRPISQGQARYVSKQFGTRLGLSEKTDRTNPRYCNQYNFDKYTDNHHNTAMKENNWVNRDKDANDMQTTKYQTDASKTSLLE